MGLCGGCWHAAHIMLARLFLQCGLLEQAGKYVCVCVCVYRWTMIELDGMHKRGRERENLKKKTG